MEEFPPITDLENIYLHSISAYKGKNKSFIKSSNIGTGFGKTYMAFLAATRSLIEAKQKGENLICIFSAPLNNQLDIEDIAKEHLKNEKIPAIKVIANYKLEEHDNPSGIFQTIQRRQSSPSKNKPKSVLEEITRLLRGKRTNTKTSGVEDEVIDSTVVNEYFRVQEILDPQSRLDEILKVERIIKQKKSTAYLKGSIETQEEVHEDLKKLGQKLHADVRSLVGAILKLDIQIEHYHQDFNTLVELLYPWSLIQRHGIGLLSMTTTKLLLKQHVQTARGNFKPLDLRQIIHEAEKRGLRNLENTRFLIFLDEADAAKKSIENELTGKLIQKSLITQCIGVLYREVGDLVYSDTNKIAAIKNYIDADSTGKPKQPIISLSSSIEALKEQLALREKRTELFTLMSKYRKAEGINILEQEINELAQLNKDHLCIAVRRHDSAIQKLGAAGLFASGTMGFLNGHSLEEVALDSRYTREMVVGGEGAFEQELSGCSRPLRHWFEMLLEALSLLHQFNINKTEFKLTRTPIFNPDNNKNTGIETHATPLRVLLQAISNSRIQEALSKRTCFERDMPLDINYAFRAPQIVYALRRIKQNENFYSVDENLFVPSMAEISYRLSSAEVFLEQLISKNAFLRDQESEEETEDQAHGLFLISATGGYNATHMSGFSNSYLDRSEFIAFLEMTNEDNKAAEHAQKEAAGRRSVDIHVFERSGVDEGYLMNQALLYKNPDDNLKFAEENAGKEEIIESFSYLLNNKFKREELNRILTSLEQVSGNRRTTLSIGDNKASEAMSTAMKTVHSSLMLTQTLRTLKPALYLLSQGFCNEKLQAPVCIIKKNLLYKVGGAKGFTPVLVILYDSNTDKELLNLSGDELKQLVVILGKNVSLPDAITVNSLITQKSDCKVTVISAWESASRGLNIVSEDSETGEKRDLDALFLIMSRHYTSAHAKWNDDPAQALSEEIERSQYIYEYLALQGGHQLQLKDLTLKTRELVPGSVEFLREQHRLMLAVGNQQGIGRIERCRVSQHQYLFIDSEILQEIANANQIMFASQSDLKKTLSLLNARVLEYALKYIQQKVYIPEDPVEASFAQDDAIDCYEQEKNEMLNSFIQLRSGAMDENQATRFIQRWNSFNSIEWLTDPKQFCESLLNNGWSKEFVKSLWVEKPDPNCHYAYATKDLVNELTKLLLIPQEVRQHISNGKIINYYTPEARVSYYKLPHVLVINSTIQPQPTSRLGSTISRPHTEPDRNGVWGEHVTGLWFKTLIPKAEKLESDYKLAEVFELFDLFYTVKNHHGEDVLLAVDAKNWSQQTDASSLSAKVIAKAPEKITQVEAWATKLGIKRVIGIYFNPRPISSSRADIKVLHADNVISVAGIIRESDVDLVLPSTEPDLSEKKQSWNSDPHLFINKVALCFIEERIQ